MLVVIYNGDLITEELDHVYVIEWINNNLHEIDMYNRKRMRLF